MHQVRCHTADGAAAGLGRPSRGEGAACYQWHAACGAPLGEWDSRGKRQQEPGMMLIWTAGVVPCDAPSSHRRV
jgi:hypothetical protein